MCVCVRHGLTMNGQLALHSVRLPNFLSSQTCFLPQFKFTMFSLIILYSANIYVPSTYTQDLPIPDAQYFIVFPRQPVICGFVWRCGTRNPFESIGSESLFHTFNTCPIQIVGLVVSPIVRHSYGISLGGSDAVRGHHCFGIHEAVVAVLHEEIFGSDGDF